MNCIPGYFILFRYTRSVTTYSTMTRVPVVYSNPRYPIPNTAMPKVLHYGSWPCYPPTIIHISKHIQNILWLELHRRVSDLYPRNCCQGGYSIAFYFLLWKWKYRHGFWNWAVVSVLIYNISVKCWPACDYTIIWDIPQKNFYNIKSILLHRSEHSFPVFLQGLSLFLPYSYADGIFK